MARQMPVAGASFKAALAICLACTIWGFSSLYYYQLRALPPLEILCYRSLWSIVFFGVIVAFRREWHVLARAVSKPGNLGLLLLSALAISGNWFGFTYAVTSGQALEGSLGYFIFPLMMVFVGRLVFRDRLSTAQWIAIALATLGVLTLAIGLRLTPWIALSLGLTFTIYSVIKKSIVLPAHISVLVEMILLSPLALLLLSQVGTVGWRSDEMFTQGLLAFSGVMTGLPLLLFSYAAPRLPLSTTGVIQYLNPSLQFFCAVVVFGEVFTQWHGIAFPFIWAGLALYSTSAIVMERRASRRERHLERSGTAMR